MKVIITNKLIVIQNPTTEIVRTFENALSYTDKQKQFQLRKLEKNPFLKNSDYAKKLRAEVSGTLLKKIEGGHITFNSGFAYMLNNTQIIDKRKETGEVRSLPWVKQPFLLRAYQEEAIEAALNNWRGIINCATGLGKSLIGLYLIKRLKRKTLIVVPSESIAKQFYKELSSAFGSDLVGYYGGGKKKVKFITIGIAASISNSIEEFKSENLGLVIFDEVHHIAANSFYQIANKLGDVGRMYGLTATDYRSDGKDILINAGCGSVIVKKDIKWGIDNGFLAKPKFIIKTIPTAGNDFINDKLKNYKAHILNNDLMKRSIKEDIEFYVKQNKVVLCLVGEVEHGLELSAQLNVPFAQGKDKESQKYVDALNNGTLNCLIGTSGKISEGTDTKRVDVLILASFVASKGPVMQSIGRALRKQDLKTEATIVDYIPAGSKMLSRHANNRVSYYREITNDITILT